MDDAGHVFIKKLRALMVDAKQAAMHLRCAHLLGGLWAIKMPRDIASIRASCAVGFEDGMRQATA